MIIVASNFLVSVLFVCSEFSIHFRISGRLMIEINNIFIIPMCQVGLKVFSSYNSNKLHGYWFFQIYLFSFK
jgi:hypothetical protein